LANFMKLLFAGVANGGERLFGKVYAGRDFVNLGDDGFEIGSFDGIYLERTIGCLSQVFHEGTFFPVQLNGMKLDA